MALAAKVVRPAPAKARAPLMPKKYRPKKKAVINPKTSPSQCCGLKLKVSPISVEPPIRHKTSPMRAARLIFSFRKTADTSITQTGAVVERKVALATDVFKIDKCQKNKSPANSTPAHSIGVLNVGRLSPPRSSIFAQIAKNGKARKTRQNAEA